MSYLDNNGSAARVRAVCIGGGTGQPNSLRALRYMGCDIDAVVAMADDGRSTGFLRRRAHILPPGDVRKCLVALAGDPKSPFALSLEHRLPYLQDHALGNLLIASLIEEGLDFEGAVSELERLLQCVGHVHPSTTSDVRLVARTRSGIDISGQWDISHSPEPIDSVFLEPGDVPASIAALGAIERADLLILGPGSLFTSIIPNLLVPQIADAVRASGAPRVFVAPLVDEQGETRGMDVLDCVKALEAHGLEGALDCVCVQSAGDGVDGRLDALRDVVPYVVEGDFAQYDNPSAHDPIRLCAAFEEVLQTCRLQRR